MGVLGARLGTVARDEQQLSRRVRVGGRLVEAEEKMVSMEDWWARCCGGLSLEVDGWMEWTRSANQAFTISLLNHRTNCIRHTGTEKTVQLILPVLHMTDHMTKYFITRAGC